MEVDGNKFRTISGQKEGKKTTSEWTTCKGKNIGKKNETTPNQQALAEAYAKMQKKLEKEYKRSIDDVDTIIFRSPMLAVEYTKVELVYPLYCQPKLDGVRCVANKDGLWTRNGKRIVSCPHIIEALAVLFDEEPDIELDGELYNHELKDDFDELISLIKQQKPTAEDLLNSFNMVQFHVYDIRDEQKIFSERSGDLSDIVHGVNEDCIVLVETRHVRNKQDLDDLYDMFLADGYEGQMIRFNTPYEFKRTNALLKRKEFITEEFEIVEVIEGKGNRAGMAGKIIIKLKEPTTEGTITCESGLKGGVKFYKRMLEQKDELIGEQATIRFQNYTPKKSLRFPVMLAVRNYE